MVSPWAVMGLPGFVQEAPLTIRRPGLAEIDTHLIFFSRSVADRHSKADFPLLCAAEFRAERLFFTEKPRLPLLLHLHLWEICFSGSGPALL